MFHWLVKRRKCADPKCCLLWRQRLIRRESQAADRCGDGDLWQAVNMNPRTARVDRGVSRLGTNVPMADVSEVSDDDDSEYVEEGAGEGEEDEEDEEEKEDEEDEEDEEEWGDEEDEDKPEEHDEWEGQHRPTRKRLARGASEGIGSYEEAPLAWDADYENDELAAILYDVSD